MMDLIWDNETEMRCSHILSATTGNRYVRNADLKSTDVSEPYGFKSIRDSNVVPAR